MQEHYFLIKKEKWNMERKIPSAISYLWGACLMTAKRDKWNSTNVQNCHIFRVYIENPYILSIHFISWKSLPPATPNPFPKMVKVGCNKNGGSQLKLCVSDKKEGTETIRSSESKACPSSVRNLRDIIRLNHQSGSPKFSIVIFFFIILHFLSSKMWRLKLSL